MWPGSSPTGRGKLTDFGRRRRFLAGRPRRVFEIPVMEQVV
jgi:hypothetical protein